MRHFPAAALLAIVAVPVGVRGGATMRQGGSALAPTAIPHVSQELRGIRRSEQARFEAMVQGDTLALRRYLAAELEYTHSNGVVETKAAHLASIGSGRTVYQSLVPSEFRYRGYGSIVVGTGSVQSRGVVEGTPFNVALRVSTVHVWRDGRWQLVVWQSTRLP